MFLIWSNEHRAWWRPHRAGYTQCIQQAGIYSGKDAMQIVSDATLRWMEAPKEVPVRVEDLPEAARLLVQM